ncbi:MAG: alpha-glucosidase, partial [Lactobacillus sp.]|nr:alpha-glucosidase [Lactobacillus sp.]
MNEWWKSSVVYQVYPQSFKDSNNDGIGDLMGIVEKLPYLAKLGVDVIWLTPIFDSPLIDNGYDIRDYEKISENYGTLEDFKRLLEQAHQLNIRVILDLVVNHTSNQHAWFIESQKNKENPYSDYYIWKDPKEDGSAPTNWGSTFGGSAWEYVESRKQYYLHCFAKEQPDLNWENPKVRQSIYKMMKKWFDLGIDGFRMDVISLISKHPDYPDAPNSMPYTKSYYVGASNGPRVHEFLQEMNREVLSKYDSLTVGETPNTNSRQAQLYTFPERKELNMVFHFDHMHLDYGKYGKFSDVRFKLSDLRATLSEWQEALSDGWNSLYWSN